MSGEQKAWGLTLLAIGLVLSLRAGARRDTESDREIAKLEHRVTALSLSLTQAERATRHEMARRAAVEDSLRDTQARYHRRAEQARAQTQAAEDVLSDTAATLAQVRLALIEQVATTHALLRAADSLSLAATRQTLATAAERNALLGQLAVADSVIAAQDSLLSRRDPPCRIAKLVPCPTRTESVVLTFVSTVIAVIILI
jgi:hypothetical protein